MDERRKLLKRYYDLKEYLVNLENNQNTNKFNEERDRKVKPMNLENGKIFRISILGEKLSATISDLTKIMGLLLH